MEPYEQVIIQANMRLAHEAAELAKGYADTTNKLMQHAERHRAQVVARGGIASFDEAIIAAAREAFEAHMAADAAIRANAAIAANPAREMPRMDRARKVADHIRALATQTGQHAATVQAILDKAIPNFLHA